MILIIIIVLLVTFIAVFGNAKTYIRHYDKDGNLTGYSEDPDPWKTFFIFAGVELFVAFCFWLPLVLHP